MKKRHVFFTVTLFLLAMVIIIVYGVSVDKVKTGYMSVKPGESKIYTDSGFEIEGWDDYGVTYFFIPSFEEINRLCYDRSDIKLFNPDGSLFETPVIDSIQDVLVGENTEETVPYRVGLFRSRNLHTVMIDMGDKDIYDISRDNYETASITVISPSGAEEYKESKAQLKGRGNSTWTLCEKKSFDLKLPEKEHLMNMKSSDKWVLLANVFDKTKLCNKMVLDTASAIGLEHITESDWADVYINGVYWGNYLICQEPDVGRESEWLISVEPAEDKGKGFWLDDNIHFRVSKPSDITDGQLKDIAEYVKSIDRSGDGIEDRVDIYSFARRYLIEETFFNIDAKIASYYFYKIRGSEKLYAGPCWDYDCLYINSDDPEYIERASILEYDRIRDMPSLDWDDRLMSNGGYSDYVKAVFMKDSEVWNRLLDSGIDRYYTKIEASLAMDDVRWKRSERDIGLYCGHYMLTESNVRFLKYALLKRLCFLADLWGQDILFVQPDTGNGTLHTVRFISEDGTETVLYEKDGSTILTDDIPKYDESCYRGWNNVNTNELLHTELPVFEDMVFIPEKESIDDNDRD